MERFFLEADAKVMDEQSGYQLLELPLDNWNRIRALKMVCPSTQAVYISPVEPHCSTVPDALDWMFDIKDYLGQLAQEA